MKQFHIFTEGHDRKFLLDYIEVEFATLLNAKKNSDGSINKLDCITPTGGWTKLKSKDAEGETFRYKMKQNTAGNIINLVIFDADTATNGGGFATRKAEIEVWKTTYGLDFELFLFPTNSEDGAFENLLEQIINPRNAPVFDCWQRFEDCLPTKTTCVKSPLTIPAKKSKIYAYMEVLHGNTKSEKDKVKDPNRDFKKTEHWNLSATALDPLKRFLHNNLD
jgi:hypothetical protein